MGANNLLSTVKLVLFHGPGSRLPHPESAPTPLDADTEKYRMLQNSNALLNRAPTS